MTEAMWKSVLKWFILTALLAYVALVSVWANDSAAADRIRGVRVDIEDSPGIGKISRQGVLSELSRLGYSVNGAPVRSVNTLKIASDLSRINMFESVDCLVTSDNYLNIHIVPMKPEARVFEPDGSSYYINHDGKQIPADARFFIDVPVIQGDFNARFKASSVLPLVRFLNGDPDLRELTAYVKADSPNDLLMVPLVQGHVVNFGDTTRLVEKKRALMTAYRQVIPRKGWNEYDTISVKFRGQLVCTRRQKALPEHGFTGEDEEVDMEEATLETIEL